jgi:hypothetical protein
MEGREAPLFRYGNILHHTYFLQYKAPRRFGRLNYCTFPVQLSRTTRYIFSKVFARASCFTFKSQSSRVSPHRVVTCMKTWSAMYGLVWASFFQIFLIVFLLAAIVPSSTGVMYDATIGVHLVIGIVVIFLAVHAFMLVKKTSCPDRIKRITKTTAILGGVQGALGVILFTLIRFNFSPTFQHVVLLLHVVTALAIIAQASSSATAFDMWEEKEFVTSDALRPS